MHFNTTDWENDQKSNYLGGNKHLNSTIGWLAIYRIKIRWITLQYVQKLTFKN